MGAGPRPRGAAGWGYTVVWECTLASGCMSTSGSRWQSYWIRQGGAIYGMGVHTARVCMSTLEGVQGHAGGIGGQYVASGGMWADHHELLDLLN